jgi:peptidoglycan/LPS O-acetylase OafA/YrhL
MIAVLGWRFLLLLAGAPPVYLRVAFDTRAAILAFGCLLVFLPEMRPRRGITLVAFGLLVVSTIWPLRGLGYAASDAIDGTLIALLLAQAMAWKPRWLGRPALRWFADRSYAVYLWHLWGLALAAGISVHPVTQAVLAVAATLALAVWSQYAIEGPALRWRDRHLRRPTPAESRVGPTPVAV